MSDIAPFTPQQIAEFAAQAAAANGFGNMSAGRSRVFVDAILPTECYPIVEDPKLEKEAMKPGVIFPADLCECIVHAANMAGVGPRTYLIQHVHEALRDGKNADRILDLDTLLAGVKDIASIKRKPADDAQEPTAIDAIIKLLIHSQTTWFQLKSRAKAAGVTNQAYFVALVDAIVDGPTLKALIADSKEAMAKYLEVKKKKFLFEDVLGHLG